VTDKIPCTKCGALILPATAERTGGICMPCKQGIRESIDESKETYKKQKEYDPYQELWNSLVDRAYKDDNGFDNLNENEKIYFYLRILDSEVYNGGMHQYFSNSSGELYEETIKYLKLLNALNSLELLKKAKKILFGNASVPKDQIERNNLMKQYPEEDDAPEPVWSVELDKIDDEYYKDADEIGEKMNHFTKKTGIIAPFIKSA